MGKITVKKGDITKEEIDVIVNAANRTLLGGGGVDGAIHKAAGPTVLEECKRYSGCATGDAVMTGAGNLRAKKIIHTPGPVWRGGSKGEAALLRKCYRNSFDLAIRHGMKSIAFPAISTGIYGYPIDEAARIAIEEGFRVEDVFEEIRYICFSGEDLNVYQRVHDELRSV